MYHVLVMLFQIYSSTQTRDLHVSSPIYMGFWCFHHGKVKLGLKIHRPEIEVEKAERQGLAR